jgi:mono/diheme cytochrome c family protein
MGKTVVLLTLAGFIASVVLAADRTVWDGVYTTAQAARGKAIYTAECQSCHGENLSGGFDAAEQVPALKREDFGLTRRDLNNLYGFVLESMPRNEPGNLSAANAVDVIAYILQQNGLPAGGTDLVPDPSVLEAILIVKKP